MNPRSKPKKPPGTVTRARSHERTPAGSPLVSQTVLAALTLQEDGLSLDIALTRALKGAEDLDPAQRRQVVRDLHELNRHRARLSWHLEKERSRLSPHHLFVAWAAFESRAEPKGGRYNAGDREMMERLARRTLNDPKMPEAVSLECPPAFEAALRAALGVDFARELRASLEPPPVDLRVNLLKAPVAEVRKRLKAEDIASIPVPHSPWGLRCPPRTNASATDAFRDGLIEFQDEGSQLATLLCDARPGMQVLDFCAGTGGKTLALAATMGNRGHVVACDISTVRLTRAKLRLKRAGAENAERRLLPAKDDKWMKKHYERFDRVLVDAPCSGTGAWRRNPDARWSAQAANLGELTALQDSILARAARFVKPGGHVIYATCSLLREENDRRVEHFLGANAAFEQVDAREVWRGLSDRPWPCEGENVLRLSPAKHGTDGFFAAILRRATNSA